MKTSCNKIKPNRTTNSDRKIKIANADDQTRDFFRPDSQYANVCKTK